MGADKLTKEDIKALKEAESVAFVLEVPPEDRWNAFSKIICRSEEKDKTIHCDAEISNYGAAVLGDIVSGAFSLMLPNFDDAWRTILEHVKEGDRITVGWRACNNNQLLWDADLYKDDIYIVIKRYSRGKHKRLNFNLSSVVCKNNTAKIIKHTSTTI